MSEGDSEFTELTLWDMWEETSDIPQPCGKPRHCP